MHRCCTKLVHDGAVSLLLETPHRFRLKRKIGSKRLVSQLLNYIAAMTTTTISTTRVLKLAMSLESQITRRSYVRPGLSNFLGSRKRSQGLIISPCNGGTSHDERFQRAHLLLLSSKNFCASSSSPIPLGIQGITNHRTNVVDLMAESEAFLRKTNLPFPIWSQEISKLFHRWHQILFKIHFKDKNTLGRCAACMDSLVHEFLEKYKENPELPEGKRNNAPFRPTEFISTGIYAWGRVAAYNRMAPVKAEAMVAKLQDISKMKKNHAHSARFQPTQEVYSAITYCWSQSPFHPEAPEKALYWMNHILDHPKMQIQAPTYNAVLRAYAKQGKIEKVKNLVTSMTVEKDLFTYQSIIEACLNSQQPQAIVEAHRALQQGLQQGLRQQEVVPLTHMFGKFLNLNRDNPEVCNTILEQLRAVQEEYPSIEILQARHLVIAMTAWAQKGQPAQVEKFFLLMEELYKRGSQRFRPTYQVSFIMCASYKSGSSR
jgi:pentatricopeptide repeat protein